MVTCGQGGGTENSRVRYQGRMWEIGGKENTSLFCYSFSEPPKNAMPLFFTTPKKKGKPFLDS